MYTSRCKFKYVKSFEVEACYSHFTDKKNEAYEGSVPITMKQEAKVMPLSS